MGQISMVMDYARLGPLDEYLRENKATVEITDLVEASANLASALWHLVRPKISLFWQYTPYVILG